MLSLTIIAFSTEVPRPIAPWLAIKIAALVPTVSRMASASSKEPAGYCQSCGMELRREEEQGTEEDGTLCADYCIHCYQRGRFTRALTMEEQAEENLRGLAQWNRAHGLSLTEEEAREQLLAFLATLNRWRQE